MNCISKRLGSSPESHNGHKIYIKESIKNSYEGVRKGNLKSNLLW